MSMFLSAVIFLLFAGFFLAAGFFFVWLIGKWAEAKFTPNIPDKDLLDIAQSLPPLKHKATHGLFLEGHYDPKQEPWTEGPHELQIAYHIEKCAEHYEHYLGLTYGESDITKERGVALSAYIANLLELSEHCNGYERTKHTALYLVTGQEALWANTFFRLTYDEQAIWSQKNVAIPTVQQAHQLYEKCKLQIPDGLAKNRVYKAQ